MSKIVFTPPSKDKPGYLRRSKRALELKVQFQEDPRPETVDNMVSFLLPYVTEPEDRGQAEEALWDASEAQFMQLMDLIAGKESEGNPTKQSSDGVKAKT